MKGHVCRNLKHNHSLQFKSNSSVASSAEDKTLTESSDSVRVTEAFVFWVIFTIISRV